MSGLLDPEVQGKLATLPTKLPGLNQILGDPTSDPTQRCPASATAPGGVPLPKARAWSVC